MVGQSPVRNGNNSRAPVALWPPSPVLSQSGNMTGLDANDGIDEKDRDALLYIVVVLLFYSSGIIVAIVMYLKREKAEIEEEKAYENFARSAAAAVAGGGSIYRQHYRPITSSRSSLLFHAFIHSFKTYFHGTEYYTSLT